jgi:hypothetical protein
MILAKTGYLCDAEDQAEIFHPKIQSKQTWYRIYNLEQAHNIENAKYN